MPKKKSDYLITSRTSKRLRLQEVKHSSFYLQMDKNVPFEQLRGHVTELTSELSRIFPSDARFQALGISIDANVQSLLEKINQAEATLATTGEATATDESKGGQSGPIVANVAPSNKEGAAVMPLCYPENFTLDEQNFSLKREKDATRSKLLLCSQALDHLRAIKEPICVVCVAGPARTGKSYLLRHLQGAPFKIGHTMETETIGLWLNKNLAIHKLPTGEDIRILLLDSEGIDATNNRESSEGTDNQIFTLSVLISSILLYNTQNVPTSGDLIKLDYVSRLSTSIGLRENGENRQDDAERFRKVAPQFYWIIRDAHLDMEDKHGNTCDAKTYLEQKVLTRETGLGSKTRKKNEVRDAINSFFSAIDAMAFSCPSANPEVLRNLKNPENSHLINPEFLRQMDTLREMLAKKYTPKKSFNGKYLTGVELADLIKVYAEALNSEDGVPNWETAWHTVVQMAYDRARDTLLHTYQEKINAIRPSIPCAQDIILKKHDQAFQHVFDLFKSQTQLDTDDANVKRHQKEFSDLCATFDSNGRQGGVCVDGYLLLLIHENAEASTVQCYDVIQRLRKTVLQPMASKLTPATRMDTIETTMKQINTQYHKEAKGPMVEKVFAEQLPLLQEDIKSVKSILQQIKTLDTKIKEEQKKATETVKMLGQKEAEAKAHLNENRNLVDRQKQKVNQVVQNHKASIAKMTQERDNEMKNLQQKLKTENESVKSSLEQQLSQQRSANATQVQQLRQGISGLRTQVSQAAAQLETLRNLPQYFFIRSKHSNKVLDIYHGKPHAGVRVITWDKNLAATNQQWYQDPSGVIRSRLNNYAMDTSGGILVTQPYNAGNPSQQWVVVGDMIKNRSNGTVLDIYHGKTGNGIHIIPYGDYGSSNQRWFFDVIN